VPICKDSARQDSGLRPWPASCSRQGARSSPLPLRCRGEDLEPQAGLERQRVSGLLREGLSPGWAEIRFEIFVQDRITLARAAHAAAAFFTVRERSR
jgi:hypothetical protein